MKEQQLYKVLDLDGSARMGTGKWHLPRGRPGKWMSPIKGRLVPCANGYHLCRPNHLIKWLGPAIYTAEHRGELIESDDKVVVREARLPRKLDWDDRTARLFACDCAEHVLHLYEKEYPDDSRVRNCIEIVRKFANGDLPIEELTTAGAAAWAAAGAAAGDARGTAAGDARGTAARNARGAWDTAYAAVRAAAGDARGTAGAAAWAAAGAAAGDARAAEREWQTTRLLQYLHGELVKATP